MIVLNMQQADCWYSSGTRLAKRITRAWFCEPEPLPLPLLSLPPRLKALRASTATSGSLSSSAFGSGPSDPP